MQCTAGARSTPSQAKPATEARHRRRRPNQSVFCSRRENVYLCFFCTYLLWHMQMGQWNSNLNHNSMRKRCVSDLRRSIRSGISLTCFSDRSILVELWRMRAQLWGIYIYTQWSLHRMMMMIVIWSDDWRFWGGASRWRHGVYGRAVAIFGYYIFSNGYAVRGVIIEGKIVWYRNLKGIYFKVYTIFRYMWKIGIVKFIYYTLICSLYSNI